MFDKLIQQEKELEELPVLIELEEDEKERDRLIERNVRLQEEFERSYICKQNTLDASRTWFQ